MILALMLGVKYSRAVSTIESHCGCVLWLCLTGLKGDDDGKSLKSKSEKAIKILEFGLEK
jgi:hypothetical protein